MTKTEIAARPVPMRVAVWGAVGVFVLGMIGYLLQAFPQGVDTLFYGLPLSASRAQFLDAMGGTDPGSYTRIAIDYLDGTISPENRWILNLWPPGVPLILWIFFALSGGGVPIVPMIVFTAVLWCAALALLAVILIKRRAFVSLALIAVAWILTPLVSGWTVHNGAISSDGIAAALAAMVAIALYFATQAEFEAVRGRRRMLYYGVVGLLLAALCLFRVTWLYAILASFAAFGLFLLIVAIVRRVRRGRVSSAATPLRQTLRSWAAVIVGFAILTVPWTVVLATYVHPGNPSWSNGDYQYGQFWMTDERLEDGDAEFLIDGEANWACELDPVECAELERVEETKTVGTPYDGQGENTFSSFQRQAILTALTHPIQFVAERSVTTYESWLSVPGEPVGSMNAPVFGIISLLTFLGSIVLLVRQTARGHADAFFLFLLLGANVGIIWLSHFETRYMLPLHAIGFIVVAMALSVVESGVLARLLRRRKEHAA